MSGLNIDRVLKFSIHGNSSMLNTKKIIMTDHMPFFSTTVKNHYPKSILWEFNV